MNEDKSARYHRLRRRASIASTVLGIAFLITIVVTGASADLRAFVQSIVGSSFVMTVALYVVLLGLLNEAIGLPFAFYQGVTLGALREAIRRGEVGPSDKVVLLVTGDGLKTPGPVADRFAPIDIAADADALLAELGVAV